MSLVKRIKDYFQKEQPTKPELIEKKLNFNKNKVFDDYQLDFQLMDLPNYIRQFGGYISINSAKLEQMCHMINENCEQFNINPKLILTLMENNDNMITRKEPFKDDAYGYALGMGMIGEDSDTIYRGLSKQLFYTCTYYKQWSQLFKKNGGTVNCVDDNTVKPQNAFTYALYSLNPYLGFKDMFVVNKICDERGRLIKTVPVLKYQAPHGVYKIWLTWNRLFK